MILETKRIIGFILLFTIILSLIISCGDNSEQSIEQNTNSNNETDEDISSFKEEEIELTNDEKLQITINNLTEDDFGGYEFTIVDRFVEADAWNTIDVFAESINGDPINDSVYERNAMIEEKYNIIIKEAHVGPPVDALKKSILANEDIYDVITDGLANLARTLAAENYLLDYYDIPVIDLDAGWWDQSMVEGLSVGKKLYYATGDISIMDNYGTWCFMFNKRILEDFSLDNPYELIGNGTWTLDKMYDMAKTTPLDLDGDGIMGEWDQYGFLSEGYNTYGLWSSSGEKIITKDSDDLPTLTMFNDRSVKVFEKVLEIQLNTQTTMTGDRHSGAMVNGINVLFETDKALFIFGGMWLISKYRASEADFGILPAPKFTEDQTKYYNTYSYGNCTAYSIPVTSSDINRTGTILEAMAAISKYTLTPAYIDKTLTGKFLRDDESEGMIELILANRNYDLGSIYDWGTSFTLFGTLYTAKSYDFTSRYAAIEEKIITAIDKYIDMIS